MLESPITTVIVIAILAVGAGLLTWWVLKDGVEW